MARARQRRLRLGAGTESSGDGDVADYRSELWRMADALRGSMDAAEYKHVVLGLIFLKYISDAFEEAYAQLEKEIVDGADPPKTRTNTALRASSGFPPRRAGRCCKPRRTNPPLGRPWTTP